VPSHTIAINDTTNVIILNTQNSIKLTGQNFPAWKVQFNALLIGYDLLSFVYGKRGYPPRSNYYPNTNKSPSSEIVTCQYCDKSGHTAKVCYKLHGYPAGYRNRRSAAHHTHYAQSQSDPNWILNFGATHDLTNALDDLHISNPYQGSDKITIGDGTTLPFAHSGKAILPSNTKTIHLHKVLHVPNITCKLLSVSTLCKTSHFH
jgi:hypothetical protein